MTRKNDRTFEHIRPKVHSRDFTVRDMLECRPPLSSQSKFIRQPVGNGLLTHCGPAKELSNALRQLGLPTNNADSPLQRGDVRRDRSFLASTSSLAFLHDHPLYKPACDSVNKPACVTTDKATCKVLYMAVLKRKSAQARQKRPFPIGPDGKTANQRLIEIFQSHPTIHREADFCRACNEMLGTTEEDPDFVTQQSINRFLKNEDSLGRSKLIVVIAEVMGVRALWLQHGRGARRHPGDELLQYATKLATQTSTP